MQSTGRRSFLKGVGLTAGYAAGSRGYAANETIGVGCIGTGERWRELMRALARLPGVRITAVADVWDAALAEGRKLADPKAVAIKDYKEVLGRADVDAVIIGARDHWHTPMTIEACAAGKDVYLEKPLTHEIAEGPLVIAAQNRHGASCRWECSSAVCRICKKLPKLSDQGGSERSTRCT